jgi:hypothetical protein
MVQNYFRAGRWSRKAKKIGQYRQKSPGVYEFIRKRRLLYSWSAQSEEKAPHLKDDACDRASFVYIYRRVGSNIFVVK